MRRLAHLKHKLWDGYAVLIDVLRAAFRFRPHKACRLRCCEAVLLVSEENRGQDNSAYTNVNKKLRYTRADTV